jgi:hypothetical protein
MVRGLRRRARATMSPFAKEKPEGAVGGEEKEERGAALLRRRPVRLKAVVAPLVHQLAARPAGEAAGRGGTPCRSLKPPPRWTAASPPACMRSCWTVERSCRGCRAGAGQVAPSPSRTACLLFTELFAASPGRQGAGLLHKGDVDVKPWTAPPCFLCSRPFRCSSPPPRRRDQNAR